MTSGPSREECEKAYTVRAAFVEAPEGLNLSGILNSSDAVTVIERGDVIKKLSSIPQVRLIEFPVVYLNAGEQKKADRQKPVKYPEAFEEDGRPSDYVARGVGLLIEVNMKSVTNGYATFSYHGENVDLVGWQTNKAGSSQRKIKIPIFHSRSVQSSLEDMTLPLNQWLFVGGLYKTLDDGTKINTDFIIQVQENKKARPSPAHDRLKGWDVMPLDE